MTINELLDQFEMQGGFCIKRWDDNVDDYEVFADGTDFECERWNYDYLIFDRRITYMYAVDGILNIEVE